MGQVLQIAVSLHEISCGECAGVYAINERVYQRHRDKGTSWNCPYCRTGWGFHGKGRVQELEKQLAEEVERRNAALARENEERAARVDAEAKAAKVLRKLKRVANGVCPDCNRTFKNLARHMCTQHTKPTASVGAKPLPV